VDEVAFMPLHRVHWALGCWAAQHLGILDCHCCCLFAAVATASSYVQLLTCWLAATVLHAGMWMMAFVPVSLSPLGTVLLSCSMSAAAATLLLPQQQALKELHSHAC
jgi:uncharacterized membrane protein